MNTPKIHELQLSNGQIISILQEGNQFVQITEVPQEEGLNGLFSKGGFFDKIITTGSKVFKKADGTPTFIGESIKDVANQFATQAANNLTAQNQQNALLTPGFNFNQGLMPQQPQSTLPVSTGNPLPPEKDNTVLYVVLGTLAAAGVGTGIYFATKGKKK